MARTKGTARKTWSPPTQRPTPASPADTVMAGQFDDAVAQTPLRRHRCAVCNARKLADDFPIDNDTGNRNLVTCAECTGNALARRRTDQAADDDQEQVPGNLPPAPVKAPVRKRKRAAREDYPLLRRKKPRTSANPQEARPKRPRVATCRICIEEKLVEEFPKAAPKPKAGVPWWKSPLGDVPPRCVDHLTVNRKNKAGPVCRTCIGASLNASIELKGPERLGCLDEGCVQIWDATDYIPKFLSNEEFTAFSEKLFDTWTKTNRQLKQCINEECGETVLCETNTAGYPHVQCVHCKLHICVSCQAQWHEGQTCSEYRWLNVDDAKSKEEIKALKNLQKQGAKRCPHCSLAVVKDGGCPSMWCTNCSRPFWWETAELVTVAPQKKVTRAQKKKEAPPPPYYMATECELDRLARVAREEAARATAASTGT